MPSQTTEKWPLTGEEEEEVVMDFEPTATQDIVMMSQAEYDELRARLTEAESDRDRYRAALEDVAGRRFPEHVDAYCDDYIMRHVGYQGEVDFGLVKDHEADARHTYPARERWLVNRARAALEGDGGADDD